VTLASEERKIVLKAREAAEYLRISLFTLNRIERQGLLTPMRTPGGHRRYTVKMLNRYLERSRFLHRTEKGSDLPAR
jgi:DNA-binding transcriptional MerR regulator